jgi:hypothetical protein
LKYLLGWHYSNDVALKTKRKEDVRHLQRILKKPPYAISQVGDPWIRMSECPHVQFSEGGAVVVMENQYGWTKDSNSRDLLRSLSEKPSCRSKCYSPRGAAFYHLPFKNQRIKTGTKFMKSSSTLVCENFVEDVRARDVSRRWYYCQSVSLEKEQQKQEVEIRITCLHWQKPRTSGNSRVRAFKELVMLL